MSKTEPIPPGWEHPKDGAGQPKYPVEALRKTKSAAGKTLVHPWVPGRKADGTGAFDESPSNWLGFPLTVKKDNAFDDYLKELMIRTRAYNHWLYRLRRARLKLDYSGAGPAYEMPLPPGHDASGADDTEESALANFTTAERSLDAWVDKGFEDKKNGPFRVVLDPVRVNDYIVSVRVLAGGSGSEGSVLREAIKEWWSSSSHLSPQSNWSSYTPPPP